MGNGGGSGNSGGDNNVKSNSGWYKNINGDKICTMIFSQGI